MKKFILQLLIFSSPFMILVLLAIYVDIFGVLGEYKPYKNDKFLASNREWICTRMYDKYRKSHKFNSFIFGSSRSQAYKCDEWGKYLDNQAHVFHYDAAGEGIYGFSNKVKYIDTQGDTIKNALIIMDRDFLTRTVNREGHLFVSPPCLSKESELAFYGAFLKASINPYFLFVYCDYHIFYTYRDYMEGVIINSKYPYQEDTINGNSYYGADREIKEDSMAYYQGLIQKGVFYERPPKEIAPCEISALEIQQLKEAKAIFNRHHTQYKIVISPIYDQVPLEDAQVQLLNQIFGKENIFNFSGKNRFTDNISNYYETSHYRPHVANEILGLIYNRR